MRIVIAGFGSIGAFAGGCLAAAGRDVAGLARPRAIGEMRGGLHLTGIGGMDLRVPAPDLSDSPQILAGADLVLVAVKSGDTAGIARLIAEHAPPAAPVVSLQNGMDAAGTLRAALPGRDVRAGMVPFNVVPRGSGRYHRATSGDILIEAGPGRLGAALSVPHLPVHETSGIEAHQWGKLLMNLNNALNALSGLPLQAQLLDRRWRRVMAAQMDEALAVLAAAGIRAHSPAGAPPRLIPHVLRLPTPLFRAVAARMLTIDPEARTSMAYDLASGKPTEIGALQGCVIALADRHGVAVPLTRRIAEAVRAAEARKAVPHMEPEVLR